MENPFKKLFSREKPESALEKVSLEILERIPLWKTALEDYEAEMERWERFPRAHMWMENEDLERWKVQHEKIVDRHRGNIPTIRLYYKKWIEAETASQVQGVEKGYRESTTLPKDQKQEAIAEWFELWKSRKKF